MSATAQEIVDVYRQSEALAAANLGRHVSVVTLTHDPKLDIPALGAALRSDAGYIGALGSRRTHEKRKQSLAAEGFSKEEVARVHGPVGLDLEDAIAANPNLF